MKGKSTRSKPEFPLKRSQRVKRETRLSREREESTLSSRKLREAKLLSKYQVEPTEPSIGATKINDQPAAASYNGNFSHTSTKAKSRRALRGKKKSVPQAAVIEKVINTVTQTTVIEQVTDTIKNSQIALSEQDIINSQVEAIETLKETVAIQVITTQQEKEIDQSQEAVKSSEINENEMRETQLQEPQQRKRRRTYKNIEDEDWNVPSDEKVATPVDESQSWDFDEVLKSRQPKKEKKIEPKQQVRRQVRRKPKQKNTEPNKEQKKVEKVVQKQPNGEHKNVEIKRVEQKKEVQRNKPAEEKMYRPTQRLVESKQVQVDLEKPKRAVLIQVEGEGESSPDLKIQKVKPQGRKTRAFNDERLNALDSKLKEELMLLEHQSGVDQVIKLVGFSKLLVRMKNNQERELDFEDALQQDAPKVARYMTSLFT